ncbi:MAG: hypothetical protein R2712_31540 [Vicinamibacterales bacterium]
MLRRAAGCSSSAVPTSRSTRSTRGSVEEIWRMALPRRVTGTLMTYRSRQGRQFVVVATSSGADASLVAFGLLSPGR